MSTHYTTREAAEKLGLSYCYFMAQLKTGRFQHHRLSKRNVYFTDEDLQAIEESCLIKAIPEQKTENN